MSLPILGQSIWRVTFDYAVTLITDDGSELRIETTFSVVTGDQTTIVEPSSVGEDAEKIVTLLGCRLETADTQADGILRLGLSSGQSIEVMPHPEFEAWTFAGPGDVKAVATPGGLTTWGLDQP